MWYDYARWHMEGGAGAQAGVQVLTKALAALPGCLLLAFALADAQEAQGQAEAAKQVGVGASRGGGAGVGRDWGGKGGEGGGSGRGGGARGQGSSCPLQGRSTTITTSLECLVGAFPQHKLVAGPVMASKC